MHPKSPQHHHRSTGHSLRNPPGRSPHRWDARRTVALARNRHELLVRYRTLTPLRSETFRRKGCEARGGVPTSVVGPSR